jgi:predicted ATPase
LVGRAETLRSVAMQLDQERFLAMKGTWGIGKTSVVFALAKLLIAGYESGAWLIDLALLNDPKNPTLLRQLEPRCRII